MIVTIDGPAGAGKSTVARRLADRLGFQFLDTGAMYRAVTWVVLESETDAANHEAVAAMAETLRIEFADGQTSVNGQNVTGAIRLSRVTNGVAEIADNPLVRLHLVRLQRELAATGNWVCEGRDQGTVAFPNAECKFFLTASPTERARRRLEQLRSNGAEANFEMIFDQQQHRDQRDQQRPVGQLRRAADAIEIISDNKSIDDVVEEIEKIVRDKISR